MKFLSRFALFSFPVVMAAAVLTSGCYFDRLTTNYNDALGNEFYDADDAILEESISDVDEEKRMKRLKELAHEVHSVYRISPGDQVEIRVYGHDDLNHVSRVGPDGTIGMIFLGDVNIGGCTINEAATKLTEGLAEFIKYPSVVITVREVSGESVTISGACQAPGVYPISDSTRIVDIYAKAAGSATRMFHGVDVDVADLPHSFVVRDGEVLPVDLAAAISRGDPLHNIIMKKGDYIYIAQKMDSSVTICGEVGHPHCELYNDGMGLIEVLTNSGWMLESHWSHVIIIRDGLANPKMYKIDVDGILAGKVRNIKLKPGDIIYVPKDNLAEYNVFVRKLLPTAQLIRLFSSRSTSISL